MTVTRDPRYDRIDHRVSYWLLDREWAQWLIAFLLVGVPVVVLILLLK